MTAHTITLRATNAEGTTPASVTVQVADPPVPGELVFKQGTPSRISLAGLTDPAGARTQGGYFYRNNLYSGEEFHNIWYEPATKELCYDGAALTAYNKSNPSTDYWIGSEVPSANSHWQFPPTVMPIPQPVGGVMRAITGGCKHTRPRFCPRDNLIHIFGGDYSSAGLINDGHQDGRMLFWNWNPQTNVWGFNYPVKGRAGEDQPLSPDIMGISWDKTREIWWITWGDPRAGVPANSPADDATAIAAQCWSSLGGQSTAWPKSCTSGGAAQYFDQWPVFVFDPKLNPPRYIKLANQPLDGQYMITLRESAYDDASKRLYILRNSSSASGVLARFLDTANYETAPLAMPWVNANIDLRAGQPNNLTGSGNYQYLQCNQTPIPIDEVGRRIFFFDLAHPAVLALTLPGHPLGEHKVQLVADLTSFVTDFRGYAQYTLNGASMPFVFIPEHRCLVLAVEPLQQMVGPAASSLTIDVDTGAVKDGPRFPSRPNGLPWFPGAMVWFPPTQELIWYACYWELYGTPTYAAKGATPGTTAVQEMYRYKWVSDVGGTPQPWKWKQLTVRVTP